MLLLVMDEVVYEDPFLLKSRKFWYQGLELRPVKFQFE